MKICAIICEYNPFHNGHIYQMQEAKRLSGADAVLCIMSGNFVQRGESAVMDKYTRARHAVTAGADVVLELPTPFATANAELFAKGATHILSSIPAVTTLSFGAENADERAFLTAAQQLNEEPEEVSLRIKKYTAEGVSFAKARAIAWQNRIPNSLLSSPNNILALEYTKALLSLRSNIKILPIRRVGAGYNDKNLEDEYASATAIRNALSDEKRLLKYLPDFVLNELPARLETSLDELEKYAILRNSTEDIAQTCDCSEGLENAMKKAAELPASLVDTLTSARYTSSRIRRIALQNLLQIPKRLIFDALRAPLYLRILGANKDRKELFSLLKESGTPLLVRAHDEDQLQGIAKEVFERDIFAEKVYALLYPKNKRRKEIFI